MLVPELRRFKLWRVEELHRADGMDEPVVDVHVRTESETSQSLSGHGTGREKEKDATYPT